MTGGHFLSVIDDFGAVAESLHKVVFDDRFFQVFVNAYVLGFFKIGFFVESCGDYDQSRFIFFFDAAVSLSRP